MMCKFDLFLNAPLRKFYLRVAIDSSPTAWGMRLQSMTTHTQPRCPQTSTKNNLAHRQLHSQFRCLDTQAAILPKLVSLTSHRSAGMAYPFSLWSTLIIFNSLAKLVKSVKKRSFKDPLQGDPNAEQSLDQVEQFEFEVKRWLSDLPKVFRLDLDFDTTNNPRISRPLFKPNVAN